MKAFVAPLAMTTRMEVIRRKVVMTLIAGVILLSIFLLLMSTRFEFRAFDRKWTEPLVDN